MKNPIRTSMITNEISLRPETPKERLRRAEVAFYVLISQMKQYGNLALAPMGTTPIKMLATLVNCDPDMMDYIWEMLNMPLNAPTNSEIAICMRRSGMSSKQQCFMPNVYYKWLGRYVKQGEPELQPVLATIQYEELRKFLARWDKLVFSKDDSSRIMLAKMFRSE